jgi:hypothetical protein
MPANVTLSDVRGRLVARVFSGMLSMGTTSASAAANRLGHGILLLHVSIGGTNRTYPIESRSTGAFSVSSGSLTNSLLSKREATDWLQAAKSGYQTNVRQIGSLTDTINIVLSGVSAPDFGPNVEIFDPSMPMSTIQSTMDGLLGSTSQFSTQRAAYLFKPGHYNLTVTLGYYIQALGLGLSPDSVAITGAVQSRGTSSLVYFWRGAENLSVSPTGGTDVWAVSQAAPFRRMHVKGAMKLDDGGGSSGGFMSDCMIDGTISSGSQQQWYTRNCNLAAWAGGVWNMFFQGDMDPPLENWPTGAVSVVPLTPVSREKPFLCIDAAGNYSVFVPALRSNSQGITWGGATLAGESMPIDQFYLARAATDSAATINAALAQGKNLILTPGIYNLENSISILRPNTVVLGLGFATLVPANGVISMRVADVDGVKIGGLLFDAGTSAVDVQLLVGDDPDSPNDHSANPTCLFDIFAREGGFGAGKDSCAVMINSNNVILDHCWLWRADHGTGVGWTSNTSKHGLIVNGNKVTVYAQMVEHHQQYQCMWNGNDGRNYFLQCEMPYDVPSQGDFNHDGASGYASYKVASTVTSHEAWGLGIYAYFNKAAIKVDNAIEGPTGGAMKIHHAVIISLGGNQGQITHVVNGTGATANSANTKSVIDQYP